MNSLKSILYPLVITFIGVLCYLMLIFLEVTWVYNTVTPISGPIEQWLPEFQEYATYGIIIACLSAVLWFIFAQWIFKVNKFTAAGKRVAWGLFTLFALLPVVVFSIIQTLQSPVQEGMLVPPLIYLLNFIITFYLATLLFSPASFKYAPVLAKVVRRWW